MISVFVHFFSSSYFLTFQFYFAVANLHGLGFGPNQQGASGGLMRQGGSVIFVSNLDEEVCPLSLFLFLALNELWSGRFPHSWILTFAIL